MKETSKYMFRDLKAEEIEIRPATIKQNGISLLLYKNARVDMDILDETVGPMNWQRKHTRENANCCVEIWDEEKKTWVSKEDTGTESETEKQKGLASDSFKRSCTNWGIGRELYSSPFIWVDSEDVDIQPNPKDEKKLICKDSFDVSKIKIENKKIIELEITNQYGDVVYKFPYKKTKEEPKKSESTTDKKITEIQEKALRERITGLQIPDKTVIKCLAKRGIARLSELKISDLTDFIKELEEK